MKALKVQIKPPKWVSWKQSGDHYESHCLRSSRGFLWSESLPTSLLCWGGGGVPFMPRAKARAGEAGKSCSTAGNHHWIQVLVCHLQKIKFSEAYVYGNCLSKICPVAFHPFSIYFINEMGIIRQVLQVWV